MQEKYIDESKQGEAFAIAEKPQNTKKLFLESYGCQMNFSDSEIVASILNEQGYNTTLQVEEADLIFPLETVLDARKIINDQLTKLEQDKEANERELLAKLKSKYES